MKANCMTASADTSTAAVKRLGTWPWTLMKHSLRFPGIRLWQQQASLDNCWVFLYR
jgi:hypothetical protein